MKHHFTVHSFIISAVHFFIYTSLLSQEFPSIIERISARDLEANVSYLASPLMKGRQNGEPELQIALNYIVSQVKLLGLEPANGKSYYQPYYITDKSIDNKKSTIDILYDDGRKIMFREPIFQLHPSGVYDFEIEGEVVFAGYGIRTDKYNYNDLQNIETEDKILLIMNRSPSSEDGDKFLFEESCWDSFLNIRRKLSYLLYTKAKAILFVTDPKSGFLSLEEQYPFLAGQIKSEKYLKGYEKPVFDLPGLPTVIFIHRNVADEILKYSGHTLEELQKDIDSGLKPRSFNVEGKKLRIKEVSKTEEVEMFNVAAFVEGSDPALKNEAVIFSGHADHIGYAGQTVYPGADDNASGCAALLELADAFRNLEIKPLRSLLFLWVTGEETGLLGSEFYVNNPLFPLKKTIANLNVDMIGRVKCIADSTSETPMTGPLKVFVITGDQSRELKAIAEQADRRTILDFDYSLSGRHSPLQLFARSDHYNFVKNDIPVLFFTTGLHTDYHTPGDIPEKLDFNKMELITRALFDIGFTLANRKEKLTVDKPFSKW